MATYRYLGSLLIVLLFTSLRAQEPTGLGAPTACSFRAKELVQSLQHATEVRRALEHGNLGDGIHYAWMDELRKNGIKRADFELEFSLGEEHGDIPTIISESYYRDYSGSSEIILKGTDASKENGLGIRYAALREVKSVLRRGAEREGLTRASGRVSFSLFDDECIPRLITSISLEDPERTPLMVAAAEGHLEVVKNLIAKGANVNVRDQHGDTALLLASRHAGASEIVSQLINSGADANASNGEGETALMWAAFADDIATVRILLRNSAAASSGNRRGETALQWALSKGDLSGYLHEGEAGGHIVEVVRELVTSGANINSKDANGVTPLIQATRSGLLPEVRELIALGADVEARDSSGRSALDYATEHRLSNVQQYQKIALVLKELAPR